MNRCDEARSRPVTPTHTPTRPHSVACPELLSKEKSGNTSRSNDIGNIRSNGKLFYIDIWVYLPLQWFTFCHCYWL